MFEDKEYIKNIVGMRDDDEIVIPLYIQIYGKKYSLLELDTIKKRFSSSAFKVGYATADALFMDNSFPVNRIGEFDLINTFTEYDESMERQIRYTVFESGDVDVKEDDKLGEEIHMYFDCLFNNVRERVNTHFKSLIEQESIPLIPKHIPITNKEDDNDDNIPYPSADDEYDSLEDLRKEVVEYSQEDDDEYPRVTAVTEGGIIGQEIEDFINDEGKYSYDDDYLSETTSVSIVETDNTDTEIINTTDVDVVTDNTDYSTDFDVF